MEILNALVPRWVEQESHPLPPESAEVVRATFSPLGLDPVPELEALYAAIGGMDNMEDEGWRLWSLAEVKKENKQPSVYGAMFSDYLLFSWCFRVRRGSSGSAEVLVDLFDGSEPRVVAASLTEFFERYAANPDDVLLVGASNHSLQGRRP